VELVLRLPLDEFMPHVVVLGERPFADERCLEQRLTDREIPLTFLDAHGTIDAPATVLKLQQYFAHLRPALVQSFLAHANIATAIAARAAGVRPVVTGIRVAERRANLHAWLARRTERWVARHVCVSHSVAEFAIHDMRLDPRKVMVIPNGVDATTLASAAPVSREELGLPPEARVLLHVGRLDVQKRIDWLLARFADALPQLPDTYLLFAGSGPSQVYLSKLASQLGVADRVRFLGWRSDVPRLLASCEALVLTSGWEGMPNVVLEAMAAGRPVVVTEVEGVRELLGSLADEQTAPRDDTTGFVQRLFALWNDSDLAARFGNSNQARVRQKFALDETAQRYVRLYHELLA
jgi:glycosyltransferase involved in cell wall biosynthesis